VVTSAYRALIGKLNEAASDTSNKKKKKGKKRKKGKKGKKKRKRGENTHESSRPWPRGVYKM
jgi:hypothetical protein